MKIKFAYLLSLFILALTVTPCVDGLGIASKAKSELAQKSDTHQEKDSDHCSPFCTCSCCATPTIQSNYTISINGLELVAQCFTSYFNTDLPNNFSSIWQPPKLG